MRSVTASAHIETSDYWDEQIRQFAGSGILNRAEWSGHPLVQKHHERLRDGTLVDWLARRMDRPAARAMSFGGGVASMEVHAVAAGLIHELDIYDVSAGSLEVALQTARDLGVADRVRVHSADAMDGLRATYDLILCVSSLHHATDMRATVTAMAAALTPGGALFASEYVGPNRFGYPHEHSAIAKRLYRAVDPALRSPWPELPQPTPADVAAADPTESVESEILLDEVRRAFARVEVTELGGALPFIIWWGLNHDALFDTTQGAEFVATLIDLDAALLASGRLPSYFSALFAIND